MKEQKAIGVSKKLSWYGCARFGVSDANHEVKGEINWTEGAMAVLKGLQFF